MKARIDTKNKSSAKKKLIPAAGSLLISAAMLSTSTYAWFTMSREVEVNNIQMTATVPEDLQISLGKLAINSNNATAVTEATKAMSLANSAGVLYNGSATTPESSWDWSSSADISAYYQFGKLMPASSTTGATIYYTPDATGVGRSVNPVAKYYAANTGLTGAAPAEGKDTANTTAHVVSTRTAAGAAGISDTWKTATYSKATGWDDTNDDGYYVDIPVWLRSSATEDINIAVSGYVLPGSVKEGGSTETELELYKSIRVAILNGDTAGIKTTKTGTASAVEEGSATTANNILPLVDAWDKTASTHTGTGADAKYTAITGITSPFTATVTNPSILDSGIYDERLSLTGDAAGKLWGVASIANYEAADVTADLTGHITTSDKKATYGNYTAYAGAPIATIKANTTSDSYGDAKKLIIRVWLDGEDEQCWNDNAGQDWKISLRFTKLDIPAGS